MTRVNIGEILAWVGKGGDLPGRLAVPATEAMARRTLNNANAGPNLR